MVVTLIVVCSRCGGLLMAAIGQKTRTCPYCGSRVDVQKSRHVGSAETAFKASEILRDLKRKEGFKR